MDWMEYSNQNGTALTGKGGDIMKCPCKGCEDRTITCHGNCERYKEYKIELGKMNKWIQIQNAATFSDRAKQRYNNNIIRKAKGWTGRRGGKDE